jgi:ligand-binding sensor domain-containing protein/two-component sensor histidine kinase
MLLRFISMLLIAVPVTAQEYSYRHYDVKDGLAGSTVYFVHQDKEGYIWFATETGLSRFDGTHFKNFTTKDGLPDNTIIRIYEDSRGRVWLVPFKNAICYYLKGKIYNQQNDTLLQSMELEDCVAGIFENKKGEIILADASHLYLIHPSNKVTPLARDKVGKNSIVKIGVSDSGYFFILHTFRIYTTDTKTFTLQSDGNRVKGGSDQIVMDDQLLCWPETDNTIHVKSALYNLEYTAAVPSVNTIYRMNDSVICLNTVNGTLFFNILRRTIEKRFLANKTVSGFLEDREGGYWFATLNNGVYRLNSSAFNNISSAIAGKQKLGVYDLVKSNGVIWAASDIGYLQQVRDDAAQLIALSNQAGVSKRDAVSAITQRGDWLAAGCGMGLYLRKPYTGFQFLPAYNATKGIAFMNDHALIVAGSNALYTVQLTGAPNHTILWTGRTTCLFYRDSITYFGTLNGLYLLQPGKPAYYFGNNNPVLRTRISSIKEDRDGTIWVATCGDGVVGLRNNRVTWHFTHDNGLSSNIGRCIAIDTGYIWVGTDKGLNRINIHTNPVSITKYSSSDGLGSDIINTLLIDGNRVYAGTPEGVSYFDKRTQLTSSVCDLKLSGITINGKETGAKKAITLPYGNNSIRFDYVAISFKSAGNNRYSYRLLGLDTAWKTTTHTSLEFILLPPGQYQLELFAINKFGVQSGLFTTQIFVSTPFWKTSWFIAGCLLISILATFFIVTQRNRLARNKEMARQRVEQQLQELEQKALRAQMNPHFIFNCLNSIQAFILDHDIEGANKYLSKFASLIRQTLDNSFQSLVSVADEIKYITTYLNLEQMRFKDMFSYTIEIDPAIIPGQVLIPGMMLQPYVENAIRHGIRHKNGRPGAIGISFYKKDSTIVCTVRDNGIGREEAQAVKMAQYIHYPSHGMQLTRERIELMNKDPEHQITVDITDHTDSQGMAAGTEITIRFPIVNHEKKGVKV